MYLEGKEERKKEGKEEREKGRKGGGWKERNFSLKVSPR